MCGGEPTKCNVWFEAWTKAVSANPSFADIVNKALNPEGGNKNLPLSLAAAGGEARGLNLIERNRPKTDRQ